MKEVGVLEAKTHLSALLDEVSDGAEDEAAPMTAVSAEETASGEAHQGQKRPLPLCSREQVVHLTKGTGISLSRARTP